MDKLKILIVALYSDKYPSIGETHGASVVAGAILNKCSNLPIDYFEVIDMVTLSDKNIESIIRNIDLNEPNIIGFSINYGTYDSLKEIFVYLKQYVKSKKPLVLFGGPIPTYIPEILLKNVCSEAIIVIGEADEAVPMLIHSWFNSLSFKLIPNLCYKIEDEIIYNFRKLVTIDNLSPPYRFHINAIFENKAQIYVESSRGCTSAGCTFCSRGLTDVLGKGIEYRRFNFERLASDILTLKNSGVSVFTFADEDFWGGKLDDNEDFINKFEKFCSANKLNLSFDASFTVNSIYSSKQSDYEQNKIKKQLQKLKNIGLRKIFLGIESGSDSQLKRFAKGHSKKEALIAIKIIRNLGFNLELGFIMFDPLCTLSEIEENIDFLYENDLARFVSFLSNELRLQVKSNYLKILEVNEKKHNRVLYKREIDYNTISYSYEYLEKDVASLLKIIQLWNKRIKGIHYSLKNLSRYGEGGILGEFRNEVIEIIATLRYEYLKTIKNKINEIKNTHIPIEKNERVDEILYQASLSLIQFSENAPLEILENQIFKNLLEVCMVEIETYKSIKKYNC